MDIREVLFSDYKVYALTDKDYQIYKIRFLSQVVIIKNKIYDQNTRTFSDADSDYVVANYQDGEYCSFKLNWDLG